MENWKYGYKIKSYFISYDTYVEEYEGLYTKFSFVFTILLRKICLKRFEINTQNIDPRRTNKADESFSYNDKTLNHVKWNSAQYHDKICLQRATFLFFCRLKFHINSLLSICYSIFWYSTSIAFKTTSVTQIHYVNCTYVYN